MSKRPQPPAPGPADDPIVVIVKRSNHSAVSAMLIAVLLVLGAVWALKGGQSKAAVPDVPQDASSASQAESVKVKREAPAKTSDVIPASSGISPATIRSSGRATFFEPTEDEETAPEAP